MQSKIKAEHQIKLNENDRALVRMSMPQPNIRTFCFMPKNNEIWNHKDKKIVWFTILTSLLLFIYCLIGFRYIYKRHFFSISGKLTILFLIANIVPIFILAFITNKYITNKKISLKNETIEDIERAMRDIDLNYKYFYEQYTSKINSIVDDISKNVNNESIDKKEINRVESLFDEFKTSSLYFIASSGEILLNKNLENTSNLSSSIASPLGQNSLSFLNKKKLEFVKKEGEAFSSVFHSFYIFGNH